MVIYDTAVHFIKDAKNLVNARSSPPGWGEHQSVDDPTVVPDNVSDNLQSAMVSRVDGGYGVDLGIREALQREVCSWSCDVGGVQLQ